MNTEEVAEGKKVTIEWEFIEIQDRHDSNWCDWTVSGVGSDNNTYSGSCQADGDHPENLHGSVTDIEQLT